MFIGRERELKRLKELYDTGKFQFPVIYGRRRVGKTALINEFVKDKDAIFFTAIESNEKQNLENFSRSIFAYENEALADSVFPSFQAALEYVFRIAGQKRVILVIDEYPYVARVSKSLASTLQSLIDKNKDTSGLFLILCGSSMSFMENHVLAYKAPLYGRRTAQFKIQPFDFYETRNYFEKFSHQDLAVVYGMVGGTPQYLLQMNDNLSLEDNIKRSFLEPASPLFEEPNNLLKQEVREPAIYNAIIAAIAGGSGKLSEISSKVGEETSACASYIKNLISLGIIKKEIPYGEKAGRKTIYKIEDNLYRFWYRFVPENIASINRGLVDAVYRNIAPELDDYMGAVFEEICIQYLWRLRRHGKVRTEFNDIGRWWGNDPKNKWKAEIDIMGTDGGESVLFGSCKWTNEKVDVGILEALAEQKDLFHYVNVELYVFAKTGFTNGCIEKANELGNVSLVTFDNVL